MKAEKVFVRYKNLNQAPPYNKDRNEKRPYDKKKYAQKSNRPRETLKIIYDSFQPVAEMPSYVQKLLNTYPKFFNKQGRMPEKDSNDSLNDFLILNRNKFMDVLKEPKKQLQPQSSSDPDWNSDDEIGSDMESKKIDEAVVEKIVEKLGDRHVKKTQNLKPHERRFLEDYYREKRLQVQDINAESQNVKDAENKKPMAKGNQKKQADFALKETPKNNLPQTNQQLKCEKPKENIWSEYQNRQVSTFVNLGFMTKIEDNQQEITAEVAQDDGMFNEDSDEEAAKSGSQPSEESLEEDDIFGDQHPTTTIKTKQEAAAPKVESSKKITQGTVVINDNLFSKIAEMVGLLPVRCNWIIKNEHQKFKVSTEYMDAYYRTEKIHQILPMISLNHSQFISNDKVETPEGLELLKDYNCRLNQQQSYINHNYQRNNKYKEKHFTHLKKK